jgi:hypothetical protein
MAYPGYARSNSKIRINRVSPFPVPANVAMTTLTLAASAIVLQLGKSNVGASTANPVVDANGQNERLQLQVTFNGVLQEHPAEPCWTVHAAAQLATTLVYRKRASIMAISLVIAMHGSTSVLGEALLVPVNGQ